jgi:hypothetical protein
MQTYAICAQLESIMLSEVSQVQKIKSPCFLSYSDYRADTIVAIMKRGCTKRRSHRSQGVHKKEANGNMLDVLCTKMNI